MTEVVTSPPFDADRVHTLSIQQTYELVGVTPRGLPPDEVTLRHARYGPNTLPHVRRTRPLQRLAAQFTDMFAVVLLVSAAVTFVAYLLQEPPDAGTLRLSFAIVGVVLLNAAIGFGQEYAAERTIEALQAMVPRLCRVIRVGERVEIPGAELVPGDVIVLEAGDAVPADCRLIETHAVTVNNAPLTGESQPLRRSVEPAAGTVPLQQASNCAFMGTTVLAGTGKAVVFATGTATVFGRIYRLTAETPIQRTPLQRQIATMARRVSALALSIGALLFLVQAATGQAVVAAFVFALGVMVALVPEGLPATLSVSLAAGVRRMAKRQALIKRLLAVEALGSTTVICTDKTGTLTRAEMTAVRCWADGRYHAITGTGYEPQGTVEDVTRVHDLLRQAALCSNARLLPPDGTTADGWRVLGDPTEGALLVAAAKAQIDRAAEERRAPRVGEIPFDPSRKLMTTIHRGANGYEAYVKGATQELLQRCTYTIKQGRRRPLDDQIRAEVEAVDNELAGQSLRVIAVASRDLGPARLELDRTEEELTFTGLIGMLDPPRPEVTDAVNACHQAGIRIVMVTGDHALTAEGIARRVGIVRSAQPRIVTGVDLAGMPSGDLERMLAEPREVLFCRVTPEDKMRIVQAFEALGEVVAVTGDGANDAPALKGADIGVAMGVSGTDVAKEAAEMVLLDDSFASIVSAVELGRSVYRNIGKFLTYVFASNIGELAPIVAGTFAGLPVVPITAIQVLSIDLGTDVLPALALGSEPPEPDTMRRPPRSRSESLFSARTLRRVLFLGGIEGLGATALFFWHVHSSDLSGLTSDDTVYREAITIVQAAIVVSQVFVGLAVRSDRESIAKIGILSNGYYLAAQALGVGLVAAISYLPGLQTIFNTAPLSAGDWLAVFGLGAVVLAADEGRKWWVRRSA